MTLQEALKQGKRIKRKGQTIQVISTYLCQGFIDPDTDINDIALNRSFAPLTVEDIVATDWEVEKDTFVSFLNAWQAFLKGQSIKHFSWPNYIQKDQYNNLPSIPISEILEDAWLIK